MVSIEAVWDRASGFIGDRRGDVARVAVPYIFLPMCLMANVMPLVGRDTTVRNLVLSAAALVLAIATIWGNLVLTAFVLDPADRGAAARTGAARLPAKILILLIELAVLVACVAPIFIVFAASGVVPMRMGTVAYPTIGFGAASFILIYTPVLFLVLIVALARLTLVDPVLVGERAGVAALLRSLRLTRGLTLKLVGVLLLYVIVSQVAVLATRTVFGTILGLLTLGGDGVNLAAIITATLVALVQTGFAVVAIVFVACLYLTVRSPHEAIIELA